MKLQKQAFTLVELIVVVTILAVLATIGFVSYSGYLVGTRDTNRISNIKALSDGLELYRTKHYLPLPEDYVEIKANGSVIAYQGYAGQNVLETIEFSNGGKDPKYDTYFSYYLTKNKKYFQLMGFLEEEENLQTKLLKQTEADTPNYSVLYPTVYGKKLGILTDTDNKPIQEVTSIVSAGELDVSTTIDEYVAKFSDGLEISGTGTLLSILNGTSKTGKIGNGCKDILDNNPDIKGEDGLYMINVSGEGYFPVYCDMTTDGGGWTLLVTSQSNGGWTYSEVISNNSNNPSIVNNYSILGKADLIKTIVNGKFQYRIDAGSFGADGGIWEVPEDYSFVSTLNTNTNINLLKKYGTWTYGDLNIESRMPYLCDTLSGLLSTSSSCTSSRWGTIVANATSFDPAPRAGDQPGVIWYWVK